MSENKSLNLEENRNEVNPDSKLADAIRRIDDENQDKDIHLLHVEGDDSEGVNKENNDDSGSYELGMGYSHNPGEGDTGAHESYDETERYD